MTTVYYINVTYTCDTNVNRQRREVEVNRECINKAEFLAVSEPRRTVFWLTPGLKREPLIALDAQPGGTWISASAVPYREDVSVKVRKFRTFYYNFQPYLPKCSRKWPIIFTIYSTVLIYIFISVSSLLRFFYFYFILFFNLKWVSYTLR